MKVAFIGAQGVGKTTILNEAMKNLPHYSGISGVARRVMAKMGITDLAGLYGGPNRTNCQEQTCLKES